MVMNSTLKAVSNLLKQRDAELQIAAIRVLGAIEAKEPGIIKMMGELLVNSGNPNVRRSVLNAFEHNPHDLALKFLLENLEKDEGTQQLTLDVIANIGSKAVPHIAQTMAKASQNVQRSLATVLPKIKTPAAHAVYIDCCFSDDPDIVRNAVHTLREEISNYNTREQGDLRDKIISALKDKRAVNNDSANSAFIISLGIIGQVQAKIKIIPFLDKKFPTQVRRHALMSLSRFEYIGTRHQDVFEAVLPILDEDKYEELVRHAVQVLSRLRPRRTDNNKIRILLDNKHIGVKVYAIHALSQLDSITNATSILELLHSPEVKLRESASEALRTMPSAVNVILRCIDEVTNKKEAFEMVRILENHGNRIKPDKAREMIAHMLELYESGDDHYQLYRMALRHLRGDVLQEELCEIATKERKNKNWDKVRDTLKLLDHTDLLTPDIRFRLATAKLKTSKKDISRSFRLSDYCLEHISIMLADDAKGFRKKLLAEKVLDPDDLYYVGYHFSEQQNAERRFGIELLTHIASKHAKTEAGKQAKKKLKVEGH